MVSNALEFIDLSADEFDPPAGSCANDITEKLVATGLEGVRIAPNDAIANHHAAIGLLAGERPREAMPFAERALALAEESDDTLLLLIGALARHDAAAAREAFEVCQRLAADGAVRDTSDLMALAPRLTEIEALAGPQV